MRGLILTTAFLVVVTTSVLMYKPGEPVQAEVQPQPVIVPYLNRDIKSVKRHETHETTSVLACTGEFEQIPIEEPETSTEPLLTSLGYWTITAYCACPICTGEYATGYTASGTLATEGRTVASNVLPFGTQVVIDGNTYTVEDTGYSPYGDNWIDIYFDSHDAALEFGVQEKEVYLLETETN